MLRNCAARSAAVGASKSALYCVALLSLDMQIARCRLK